MKDLTLLQAKLTKAIADANSSEELERLRVDAFGKKGEFTALFQTLSSLDPSERPSFGKALNQARHKIQALLDAKTTTLADQAEAKALSTEQEDITLDTVNFSGGRLHPITAVMEEICDIFFRMGFEAATGPQIEDDFHNFSGLNIPEDHPARQMHDTFYLKQANPKQASLKRGDQASPQGISPQGVSKQTNTAHLTQINPQEGLLLRTHTSSVQLRYLQAHGSPCCIIAPGRVYRADSDQTHTPMFHQVEGLCLAEDSNYTMAHLKNCLERFISEFFGGKAKVRLRPSYFPFTEPSAELDVKRQNKGWMEVLGCGMVHPNVLRTCGINPVRTSGFAFGLGVERLAMLKYNIQDLRQFFGCHSRWLEHYGINVERV